MSGRSSGGPATEGVPPCTACGACCFSELPEYVRVFGVDYDRMDDRARGHTHFLGNRCYMRMEGGRCVALVVEAGAEGPRFTCAIYDQRPDVCRSLERGSGGCRADRHEKSGRVLLAVSRLLEGGSRQGAD